MNQSLASSDKQVVQQSGAPFTFLKIILMTATGLLYYFSNPRPYHFYDYTFRLAENLLSGRIGLTEQPPSWLNEMIGFENLFYSAFPLGSVLTMMPFAGLKTVGLIEEYPAGFVAAMTASLICWFLISIAQNYQLTNQKRLLLAMAILFGTWMWTNLMMAGAWHVALGFTMLGELGAIYFAIVRRNAFLTGCFFALAFGNRTEVLLIAPIFAFLLIQSPESEFKSLESKKLAIRNLSLFCLVPFILGVLTLGYNYVRFHSLTDFGYARIPGVLNEPWYRYGIFALWYVPLNFQEMLLTLWKLLPNYPYLVPTGFGGAIWLSSPFLFFLLRWQVRNKIIYRAAWTAIAVLTFLLWIHGNPGGWQFSYRYAMVLLPWIFIILLENSSQKITFIEGLVYGFSFLANAWATYLFFWTDYVKP